MAVTRSAVAVFPSVSAVPSSLPGSPKLVTMSHVMRKSFHKRSDVAHDCFGSKRKRRRKEYRYINFTELFDAYFY